MDYEEIAQMRYQEMCRIVGDVVFAMGRAIMELSLANQPITQEAVVEKLEQYRKETGNVIGKGVNRDAAEIVRKGSAAID